MDDSKFEMPSQDSFYRSAEPVFHEEDTFTQDVGSDGNPILKGPTHRAGSAGLFYVVLGDTFPGMPYYKIDSDGEISEWTSKDPEELKRLKRMAVYLVNPIQRIDEQVTCSLSAGRKILSGNMFHNIDIDENPNRKEAEKFGHLFTLSKNLSEGNRDVVVPFEKSNPSNPTLQKIRTRFSLIVNKGGEDK